MTKLVLMLFIFFRISYAQQINLDEDFSDWNEERLLFSDQLNDNQASIDFGKVYASDDTDFIYFFLEVGTEINLQDKNSITLYIDTDNNSATGFKKDDLGVDLEFTFGTKRGKYYSANGSYVNVNHDDISLVNSPTVTSDKFEFRFSKNSIISNTSVFPSDTIKIFIQDPGNDRIPDSGSLKYSMFNSQIEFNKYSIKKKDENHLRILTYNVERDSPFDINKKQYFERIIKAVNPDIICFQEIYDHSASEVKSFVASILPNETWYSSIAVPDIITVSKFDIIKTAQTDGNGIFLLDLRPKYDSDLFIISAHTPCCTNDNGRQEEIDAFMNFLRNSKNGTGSIPLVERTPIIIVGDMNLVGLNQQQKTLLTGDIFYEGIYGPDFKPDWDDTALEDAKPVTTNTTATFTWFSESSSFFPGRLDYVAFSNSVLTEENSFALFTRELPVDSLTAYNLQKEDVINAADHLPVIVDFSLDEISNLNETKILPNEFKLEQNYPNPFNPITTIKYAIPQFSNGEAPNVKLNVYDILGNEIITLVNEQKSAGFYSVNFNAGSLASGVYFYKMQSGNYSEIKKILLLR